MTELTKLQQQYSEMVRKHRDTGSADTELLRQITDKAEKIKAIMKNIGRFSLPGGNYKSRRPPA